MTEARCGNCGRPILHEAGRASLATAATCPRCSGRREPSAIERAAEQLIGEAGAEGGSGPDRDPYRTGTIVLEGEAALEPAPAVEVKVKGFLTQEGLSADAADFRLRGGRTVVGRRQGEILVDDPAVSSRHFQIEERSNGFFVRDLGSSNGTFLNDRLVRSAPLRTGDRIQAGSTVFVFSVRHSIPT